MLKWLLIVTALVEAATGAALAVAPSRLIELLLGEGLSSPSALILARVTAAALVSIGVACGLSSRGDASGGRSLVGGMLIYNLAVPTLLIHAALALGMHGIALWPASVLHLLLAIACAICLGRR